LPENQYSYRADHHPGIAAPAQYHSTLLHGGAGDQRKHHQFSDSIRHQRTVVETMDLLQ